MQSLNKTNTNTVTISAQNIAKSYGKHVIWSEVSFELQPGNITGITGASGSGKTTLLNTIGLLEPVNSGNIYFNDTDVTKLSSNAKKKLYKQEVGFLFQNYALIESWTVEQNLDLALEFSKLSKTEKKQAKEDILNEFGILDKLNDKVFTLSGGQQQRVALARLYLKKPSVILADEPTSSLDRSNAELVLSSLEEFANDGATIAITTHSQEVTNLCDATIEL